MKLRQVAVGIDIGTTWIRCQAKDLQSDFVVKTSVRRQDTQNEVDLRQVQQIERVNRNLLNKPIQLFKETLEQLGTGGKTECHLSVAGYWPGLVWSLKTRVARKGILFHDHQSLKFAPETERVFCYHIKPRLEWLDKLEAYGKKVDLVVIEASHSVLMNHLCTINVVDRLTAIEWGLDDVEPYLISRRERFTLPKIIDCGTRYLAKNIPAALSESVNILWCYGGIPDSVGSFLELPAYAQSGDYWLYLGSFGFLCKIVSNPTPRNVLSAKNINDLFIFINSYPQEGQWAEALDLTRPPDEERITPLPFEYDSFITVNLPKGKEGLRSDIVVHDSTTWVHFALFRARAIQHIPPGSRLFVTGGGANAFVAGHHNIANRQVIIIQGRMVGALLHAENAAKTIK